MSGPATRPVRRPGSTQRQPLYLRRPLIAGFLRQWPLLVVLVVVGCGLLLVAAERWRSGLVVMGLAVVVAGLFRLLLPLRRIGFLAVRSRPVDVTLMLATGVAVAVIALAIPHT
jgi:MFS superfamily sulfate permease-like transporter